MITQFFFYFGFLLGHAGSERERLDDVEARNLDILWIILFLRFTNSPYTFYSTSFLNVRNMHGEMDVGNRQQAHIFIFTINEAGA
jgi:hypothetical protein